MYEPPHSPPTSDVTFTVSQIPPPREAPPVRRSQIGAFLGIASLVVFSTAFSVLFFTLHGYQAAGNTATPAQRAATILGYAAKVHLRDTQFTIKSSITSAYSDGATSNGTSIAATMTGTGAITARPFRMHLILHMKESGVFGSKPVVVTAEEILDSTDLYIKMSQLPGMPKAKKPWTKIPFGNLGGTTGGLNSSNPLDFSQLRHATYVGEETIDGYKTWHLRATFANLLSDTSPATATAIAGLTHGTTIQFVEDLWFREDTYFPVQIVSKASTGFSDTGSGQTPTSSPTASFSSTMVETMVFTTWNTGITIALPPANQITTSTIPPIAPGAFGLLVPFKYHG
jgi:hypothetical protein